MSGGARQDTGTAKYHLILLEAAHLFGRERHVVRPFTLEFTAGDFAFAGHGRIAISLLAGTLNSAAACSIAAASSGASTSPSQTALLAIL